MDRLSRGAHWAVNQGGGLGPHFFSSITLQETCQKTPTFQSTETEYIGAKGGYLQGGIPTLS